MPTGPGQGSENVYTKILATTDGSEGARRAVERAIELASLFNADLHLLYVVDADQFSSDKPKEAVEELLGGLEADGHAAVEELEGLAVEADVRNVHTELHRGVPSQEILNYVADQKVELVVMGTHGESGYESARLGTTAKAVASRVDVPLLLV